MDIALEWTNHIKLGFREVPDDNAEVRVDFRWDGHWSYVGTDVIRRTAADNNLES